MKKLFLLLVFVCGVSFGQEKIDDYSSDYFKKDFSISVTEEKDKRVNFYLQTNSLDKTSKEAILILRAAEVDKFKIFVSSLKETYSKWSKTALENKVTELDKKVEYEKIFFESAFSYGKWNFDFKTYLSARFKIISGKYVMIIESDELQSSSNSYIKSTGFVIVFSSEKEFDDFLSKIDVKKAEDFFNSKRVKEDLFKN